MTTRAIGRISGNLDELMRWAHAHERKGSKIAVEPLGKDRWQVTISIPRAVEIGSKRKAKEEAP